jgi:hypothetical protein
MGDEVRAFIEQGNTVTIAAKKKVQTDLPLGAWTEDRVSGHH